MCDKKFKFYDQRIGIFCNSCEYNPECKHLGNPNYKILDNKIGEPMRAICYCHSRNNEKVKEQ